MIDLGSGGGFDVFVAAQKVGPRAEPWASTSTEYANPLRARLHGCHVALSSHNQRTCSHSHAAMLVSILTPMSLASSRTFTSIPLADGIADCLISNCVINLVPENTKHLVFKEMFRLLKIGGRIAISDLLALKELPDTIRSNIAAYVGCIAGAAKVSQYEEWLHDAGFFRRIGHGRMEPS